MKAHSKVLFGLFVSMGLGACNQVGFEVRPKAQEVAQEQPDEGSVSTPAHPINDPDLIDPVFPDFPPVVVTPEPPPVVVTPPEPPPVVVTPEPPVQPPTIPIEEKSGVCSNGQNVSGCLQCQLSPRPPAPIPSPLVLSKAEKLIRILALSCPIQNKSDPNSYTQYPSEDALRKRLGACTDQIYPETATSSDQSQVIADLMAPDAGLRQKFFGGLWYKPPYTDYFELYFGLESVEARRIFCYQNKKLEGDLLTSEYMFQCRNSRSYPDCWDWKNNRAAQERWRLAQSIRSQLKSCLDRPYVPPPVAAVTTETEVPSLCQWKSWEGPSAQASAIFNQWKIAGWKLSIENSLSCQGDMESLPASDRVKVVGVQCP